MVRTIYLHGALGARFGHELRLDVASPAEAVRALCVLLKGFREHVEERHYQVYRGDQALGIDLGPDELHLRFSDDEVELHIIPRAIGAKNRGIGKIILGGLLIAASFIVPGAWMIAGKAVSGIVAQAGIAMILGGVSQLLAPQIDNSYDEQPKSDLFGGVLNVTTPGVAVPVIVGECEVGSVVISSAIHIEDRPGAGETPDDTPDWPPYWPETIL